MSTTDPAESRREQRRRHVGDRRILAAAFAGAAAVAASAFLLGLAISTSTAMLRHGLIDSVFDDRDPFPTFWGIGTMGYLWMLGTFGTIAASGLTVWLLHRYRGGEQQSQILAPLATCMVALAITLNAPTWLAPLEVGTKLDPVFHEDTPWSVFGWIAYYADIWFPALALVIAGLVVAYAIGHHRRLRRQLAARDRLLAEGRRVKGAITGLTIRTSVNDQGQRSIVGAEVTVKFTDAHGVARWVTRFHRDRSAMFDKGVAEVLFDPLRPGDDDLIFISFQPEPIPAEWIGPTL